MRKHLIYLILISGFILACKPDLEAIDQYLFFKTGKTFFDKPAQVNLKDIHYEKGQLLGKEVVVHAFVKEISAPYAFAVVRDKNTNLVVKLTLIEGVEDLHLKENQKVSLLGMVERNQKAYPVLNAKSIYAYPL